VRSQHPIRSQLVYAGGLFNAPPPFGLGMRLTLPALPNSPFGAPISVARLTFDLGGDDIVYYALINGRRVRYRPGGLTLPARCPHGGFPFRATVGFADGSARSGGAIVPCPRR
jgi:prepilin-type processing-associated H-X9-DG protein